MNNKCIYYVEGPCEQQLIAALKEAPERLIPGKVKVFNVVQNLIPKSQMLAIQAGTTVVLVFDTDVPQTSNIKKNLELLARYCGKLKIVFLPQVLNLEDKLDYSRLWMTKPPEAFAFVENNGSQIKTM